MASVQIILHSTFWASVTCIVFNMLGNRWSRVRFLIRLCMDLSVFVLLFRQFRYQLSEVPVVRTVWNKMWAIQLASLPFIDCNTSVALDFKCTLKCVFTCIQSIQLHLFLYEVVDICFDLSQHISILTLNMQCC